MFCRDLSLSLSLSLFLACVASISVDSLKLKTSSKPFGVGFSFGGEVPAWLCPKQSRQKRRYLFLSLFLPSFFRERASERASEGGREEWKITIFPRASERADERERASKQASNWLGLVIFTVQITRTINDKQHSCAKKSLNTKRNGLKFLITSVPCIRIQNEELQFLLDNRQ